MTRLILARLRVWFWLLVTKFCDLRWRRALKAVDRWEWLFKAARRRSK